jgi:hypothetical protein
VEHWAWVFAVGAGFLALHLVRRWFARVGESADAAFLDSVIESVASLLAEETAISKVEALARAKAAIKSKDTSLVTPIVTVDLRFERTNAASVRIETAIFFGIGASIGKRLVTQDLMWEDVPSEFRSEMLKQGSHVLRFRLIGARNGNEDGGP